ncbi:GntR family transcriptional regulator [Aliiglaciecola sp. 3_MG-2023]|uniref:GntR family transcriptional regulator n=1 Tax=Aliiglaciecola sp. 3_MG-2023 TaxID=3062644 RepID=UPI0026E23FCA|nr:GntR family transcriptional regulator [Aliiglaciecola sp. 3_MG-2023]MDO6695654.1 GntR family transcriptional regulator [Aliiglaciecola sp. 3_MG-2023]
MSKQQAQILYNQIKLDIQENKLPIGQALKQEMLSQRYNISRIPIRDVLQRLKNEGWLTTCGKRGVMIPMLNATEAEDLYLMRKYLEPLILEYAIPNINQQVIGKATDYLHIIDSQEELSIEEHGELNWQFHSCLYEQANRPTLFSTIASLHQLCGRYIGYHNQQLNYLKTSQQDHYNILKAIENKNTEHAKNLLETHISDAGKTLVRFLLAESKNEN